MHSMCVLSVCAQYACACARVRVRACARVRVRACRCARACVRYYLDLDSLRPDWHELIWSDVLCFWLFHVPSSK